MFGVADRDCVIADGVDDGESPEELDGVREGEGDTASMQMSGQLLLKLKLRQSKQATVPPGDGT